MLDWGKTDHHGPIIAPNSLKRNNHMCKFCIHWTFKDAIVITDGHSQSLRSVSRCGIYGYGTCENMYCGLFDFRLAPKSKPRPKFFGFLKTMTVKLHYGVRLRIDQIKYLKTVEKPSEWIREAIDEKRNNEKNKANSKSIPPFLDLLRLSDADEVGV